MDKRENPDPNVIPISAAKKSIEDKITRRNTQTLDPNERAEYVHSILFTLLQDPEETPNELINNTKYWSVLSYTIHFIGQATVFLDEPDLRTAARVLNNWLYSRHYSLPDDADQFESRAVEEEFWSTLQRRINGLQSD